MNLAQGRGSTAAVKILTFTIACLSLAILSLAQAPPVPPGGSVYASGLEGPRGLTFGPDASFTSRKPDSAAPNRHRRIAKLWYPR